MHHAAEKDWEGYTTSGKRIRVGSSVLHLMMDDQLIDHTDVMRTSVLCFEKGLAGMLS